MLLAATVTPKGDVIKKEANTKERTSVFKKVKSKTTCWEMYKGGKCMCFKKRSNRKWGNQVAVYVKLCKRVLPGIRILKVVNGELKAYTNKPTNKKTR